MNRKELIAKLVAQGVSEADAPTLADSILADHSKIATDLRSKVKESEDKIKSLEQAEKSLNEQLGANKAQLDTLGEIQSQLEDSTKQLTDAQSKLSQSDLKFSAFNEVIKTNPHDPADVMKFVDLSKVTQGENGALEGLAEQIKGLQESKAYLFQGELTQQGYKPASSKGEVPADPVDTSKMSFEDMLTKGITEKINSRTQTNQPNSTNVQD